ncbi:aprataxin and PNK-like factor isoform X2 [Xenopus laevis]|uniref:Aprataxin and PNK-like factor isoform X2 n=1 Tax=Xenopus laevis TaxID=8355 RepID=A0A8J1KQQ7_XENLA|nr:aprataxin and PNK-like factor isoform X2 [Xenopus laevis]
MSGFQLEAVEGSGGASLSEGETMIGRGPFLGVHVNPCFYQGAGENSFMPLEKDKWHWLHGGDCISLLPDKYAFRVIADASREESTQRNIPIINSTCELADNPGCSSVATKTKDEEPSCSSWENKKPYPYTTSDAHSEKVKPPLSSQLFSSDKKNSSAQRKRVLPGWMLDDGLEIKSLSSPASKAGKRNRIRREKNITTSNTDGNISSSKHQVPSYIKEAQEEVFVTKRGTLESQVSPGTLCTSLLTKARCEQSNDDNEMILAENKDKYLDVQSCQNINDVTNWCSENGQSGSSSVKHIKASSSKTTHGDDLSLSPDEDEESEKADFNGGHQAAKKRTPCMYGDNCYRKNPAHFQEFCHPGDSDYNTTEKESEDDSDKRPECPYGTDCYRKNPQHKLEYKHTKPPEKGGRKLRKRAPKKGKGGLDDDSDNDGEPNDYDLEDSFIDDDEEDFDNTDEDSDWMPEPEEKDSEDMGLLVKEAKRFVKGKH